MGSKGAQRDIRCGFVDLVAKRLVGLLQTSSRSDAAGSTSVSHVQHSSMASVVTFHRRAKSVMDVLAGMQTWSECSCPCSGGPIGSSQLALVSPPIRWQTHSMTQWRLSVRLKLYAGNRVSLSGLGGLEKLSVPILSNDPALTSQFSPSGRAFCLGLLLITLVSIWAHVLRNLFLTSFQFMVGC